MSRRKGGQFDLGDALAVLAGAAMGVALGYAAGETVGRVDRERLSRIWARWREGSTRRRSAAPWTEEDAERLEAAVLDALKRDVVLARRAIRVKVLGMGLVELTGRVAHVAEVGLAGDTAAAVKGVDTVLNHLLVTGVDETVVRVGGPQAPRAARG
jgi:hypothetical protein